MTDLLKHYLKRLVILSTEMVAIDVMIDPRIILVFTIIKLIACMI